MLKIDKGCQCTLVWLDFLERHKAFDAKIWRWSFLSFFLNSTTRKEELTEELKIRRESTCAHNRFKEYLWSIVKLTSLLFAPKIGSFFYCYTTRILLGVSLGALGKKSCLFFLWRFWFERHSVSWVERKEASFCVTGVTLLHEDSLCATNARQLNQGWTLSLWFKSQNILISKYVAIFLTYQHLDVGIGLLHATV